MNRKHYLLYAIWTQGCGHARHNGSTSAMSLKNSAASSKKQLVVLTSSDDEIVTISQLR